MNEDFMGLERHEGEQFKREFFSREKNEFSFLGEQSL